MPDAGAELAAARATWESTGITDYEYIVFYGAFNAAHGYHKLTVVGDQPGKVGTARPEQFRGPHRGRAARGRRAAAPVTIDEIFDTLAQADEAEWMQVDYDTELGYPRHVYIDRDLSGSDDELEVRVSLLHVARAPATGPATGSADTASMVAAAVGAHAGQRGPSTNVPGCSPTRPTRRRHHRSVRRQPPAKQRRT